MQAIGRQAQQAPDGAPVHYERHRPELSTLYWRPGSHLRRLPDTPCSAQHTTDCVGGGTTLVPPGAVPASGAARP